MEKLIDELAETDNVLDAIDNVSDNNNANNDNLLTNQENNELLDDYLIDDTGIDIINVKECNDILCAQDRHFFIIYGPSGSGKTYFLGRLMPFFQKKRKGIYIRLRSTLKEKEEKKINKLVELDINELNIYKIRTLCEHNMLLKEENKKTLPITIIFDDFQSLEGKDNKDLRIEVNNFINWLSKNGGHYDIWVFCLAQSLVGQVDKNTRANCSVLLCLTPVNNEYKDFMTIYFPILKKKNFLKHKVLAFVQKSNQGYLVD